MSEPNSGFIAVRFRIDLRKSDGSRKFGSKNFGATLSGVALSCSALPAMWVLKAGVETPRPTVNRNLEDKSPLRRDAVTRSFVSSFTDAATRQFLRSRVVAPPENYSLGPM